MHTRFVASVMILICCWAHAAAQPADYKTSFRQDLRGQKAMADNLRAVGEGVRWESAGARVTKAAGHDRAGTAGISASFQVKGDFEITTSFEIMNAETPADGYGVGISIYAAIDTDTQHSVSLARRVMPNGNAMFVSDRMQPTSDQPEHYSRSKPAKSNVGKLRIQRVGANVRFLVADGADGEFAAIPQTPKGSTEKTDVVSFGSSDLRFVQIGADAGTSQAGFDVRFFDFTIRAEELPGMTQATKAPVPSAPSGSFFQPPPPASSSNPWMWLVYLGPAVVLMVGGAGAWYYLKRRKASKAVVTPKVKPTEAANGKLKTNPAGGPIPVACANCDKKLRVKPEYAGKRVKCTQCGKPVLVPSAA